MSLSTACSRYLIPGIPLRAGWLVSGLICLRVYARTISTDRLMVKLICIFRSRVYSSKLVSRLTPYGKQRDLRSIFVPDRSVTAKRDYAVVRTESISISHESRDLNRRIRVEETPIARYNCSFFNET